MQLQNCTICMPLWQMTNLQLLLIINAYIITMVLFTFYVMSFIFCIRFHLGGLILFNDIVILFLLKGVLGSSQLQITITPVVWLL